MLERDAAPVPGRRRGGVVVGPAQRRPVPPRPPAAARGLPDPAAELPDVVDAAACGGRPHAGTRSPTPSRRSRATGPRPTTTASTTDDRPAPDDRVGVRLGGRRRNPASTVRRGVADRGPRRRRHAAARRRAARRRRPARRRRGGRRRPRDRRHRPPLPDRRLARRDRRPGRRVEESEDVGFTYTGRFWRSADGRCPRPGRPALTPCGSISLLTIPSDNGTWSTTHLHGVGRRAAARGARPARSSSGSGGRSRTTPTGSTASRSATWRR